MQSPQSRSPRHRMDVGILTVIPPELEAVRTALGLSERNRINETAEKTIYWRSTIWSERCSRDFSLVLATIGAPGTSSAAALTTQMIERYRPRVIILVGIAAGVRDKIRIGEVVLAERVVAYEPEEVSLDEHGGYATQPRPEISRMDHGLQQVVIQYKPEPARLAKLFASIGGEFPNAPAGQSEEWERQVVTSLVFRPLVTIASGDKLLRNRNKLLDLRRDMHSRIEVGEMEAAGIVEACRLAKIPWLVFRGVSDFGDHFKDDRFHEFAAKTAATVMVDFLRHGLNFGESTTAPEHPGARRVFAAIPPPPPCFVPRPDELQMLKSTLVRANEPAGMAMTIVCGMGGTGKSVLAATACRSEEVQGAFSDGIIWISIGATRGDLSGRIREIGRALGDPSSHYDSEHAAINRLRQILCDKAVLIVLDDVWSVDVVEAFRGDAPNSHLLITTRDSSIGVHFGATAINVGPFQAEQAVSLLKKWAPMEAADLPTIATTLGCLPLAVRLVGARLREGITGADWLRTFRKISQIELRRHSTNAAENLELCFDLSAERLEADDRELYYSLGVFPPHIQIPRKLICSLWMACVPMLTVEDCDELLLALARLSLIDNEPYGNSVAMHDLLHAYTRTKLGKKLVDLNEKLLRSFNPRKAPWPAVPYDAYVHEHLAYHLIQCGRVDELCTLITESPAWMDRKNATLGNDASFLTDVHAAFEACAQSEIPAKQELLARLETVRQVVNQRVDNYSDTDLKTLVLLNRESEAIDLVRLRPQNRRLEGLLAIANARHERGRSSHEILNEAMGLLEQCANEDHARSARSLVEALIEARRYDEAERVAYSIRQTYRGNGNSRDEVLTNLCRTLCRVGLKEAAKRVIAEILRFAVADDLDLNACEIQIDLARAIHGEGLRDEARGILVDTQSIYAAINAPKDESNIWTLLHLANAFSTIGDSTTAKALHCEALENAEHAFENFEESQGQGIRTSPPARILAQCLLALGKFERARAISFHPTVSGTDDATDILREILVARINAGHPEKKIEAAASEAWDACASNGRSSTTNHHRRRLMTAIAEAGDTELAARILGTIDSPSICSSAADELVERCVQTGKMQRALATVHLIRVDKNLISALGQVVPKAPQDEDKPFVNAVLLQLDAIAQRASTDEIRAVAYLFARWGHKKRAETTLALAQKSAGRNSSTFVRAQALNYLCRALAARGATTDARLLLETVHHASEYMEHIESIVWCDVMYLETASGVDSTSTLIDLAESLLAKCQKWWIASHDSWWQAIGCLAAGLAGHLQPAQLFGAPNPGTSPYTIAPPPPDCIISIGIIHELPYVDSEPRRDVMRALASLLAIHNQNPDELLPILDAIKHPWWNSHARRYTSEFLMDRGHAGLAIATLQNAPLLGVVLPAWSRCAGHYLAHGVATEYQNISNQVESLIAKVENNRIRERLMVDCNAAQMEIGVMLDWQNVPVPIENKAQTLSQLSLALWRAGRAEEAQLPLMAGHSAISEAVDSDAREKARKAIAYASGVAGHLEQALRLLTKYGLDVVLATIFQWEAERANRDLSATIVDLTTLVRIAGWARSDWQNVAERLSTSSV